MKTHRTILILGVLVLGAIALASAMRSSPEGGRPPLRRQREPLERPTEPPVLATIRVEKAVTPPLPLKTRTVTADRPADPPFWEGMSALLEARLDSDPHVHRTAVVEETARYLGLDKIGAEVFQTASRLALEEIDQAWRVREDQWLTISANVSLEGDQREQVEREIQARYETQKRAALDRLEGMLGVGARSQDLKERLEEWIDVLR